MCWDQRQGTSEAYSDVFVHLAFSGSQTFLEIRSQAANRYGSGFATVCWACMLIIFHKDQMWLLWGDRVAVSNNKEGECLPSKNLVIFFNHTHSNTLSLRLIYKMENYKDEKLKPNNTIMDKFRRYNTNNNETPITLFLHKHCISKGKLKKRAGILLQKVVVSRY